MGDSATTPDDDSWLKRHLVATVVISIIALQLALIVGQHRMMTDLTVRLDQARQQIDELIPRVERAEAIVARIEAGE